MDDTMNGAAGQGNVNHFGGAMTTDDKTLALAASAISPILGGAAPNGTNPDDLGDYKDIYLELVRAYDGGGTDAVQKAGAGLAKAAPELARFLSAGQGGGAKWGAGLTPAQMAELPPKQFIVDRLFGRGDLALFWGDSAVGKSFVVFDLCMALALAADDGSGKWAREFDIKHACKVAYFTGEGQNGIGQRLKAIMEQAGVDDAPNLRVYTDAPQLYDTVNHRNLFDLVADIEHGFAPKPDVIVIDTFATATIGADENSAQDMMEILHHAKQIATKLDAAVILIHHTNKSGLMRGSSALKPALDLAVEFSGASGTRTMKLDKLKDGAPWEPRNFSLASLPPSAYVVWHEMADSKTGDRTQPKVTNRDKVYDYLRSKPGQRMTVSAIMDATHITSRSRVSDSLKELSEQGLINADLRHPDRDGTPQNPMMYWAPKATGGDAAGQDEDAAGANDDDE